MQTKRIFSAFAFTLLTILLLLVVASRSSEAAKADSGIGNVDASINTVVEPSAKPGVLPGGKEEQAAFKRIENFLGQTVYKIPIDPQFGEVPEYKPEEKARKQGRPHKQSRPSRKKSSSRSIPAKR